VKVKGIHVRLKNGCLLNFHETPMMIDSYDFGRVTIDGKSYNTDLLVFPNKIKADWWRKKGHHLQIADLKEVLEAKPAVLVVGTGYSGMMKVPPETRNCIESEGIELIVQKTAEACQTFNHLIESRTVVAALHLTC
jgi:hypothetical protein